MVTGHFGGDVKFGHVDGDVFPAAETGTVAGAVVFEQSRIAAVLGFDLHFIFDVGAAFRGDSGDDAVFLAPVRWRTAGEEPECGDVVRVHLVAGVPDDLPADGTEPGEAVKLLPPDRFQKPGGDFAGGEGDFKTGPPAGSDGAAVEISIVA